MNPTAAAFTLTYPTRADLERLILSFSQPAIDPQAAVYRPVCINHLL